MHDDYELFEVIGRGSLGVVHRARDLRLDQDVAVKVIAPDLASALAEHPQYWSRLGAAARLAEGRRDMVRVIEVDPGRGWIVSELMAGNLRRDRPYSPRNVAVAIYQALRPLGRIHDELDQIHGAIHPKNLMRDQAGGIRLADPRGIAGPDDYAMLITPFDNEPGAEKGAARRSPSAKYLAPEWFDADFGPIGPASDFYALGVSALELLLGSRFQSLFRGVSRGSVNPTDAWARWHRNPRRRWPAAGTLVEGLPESLAEVIDRLTAKDVDRRYATAEEALEPLRADRDTLSPPRRAVSRSVGKVITPQSRSLADPVSDSSPRPVDPSVREPATTALSPRKNPVRAVAGRSPVRTRHEAPPTLGQYLAEGASLVQGHLARNRATQFTLGMIVVMTAVFILFGVPRPAEAEVTFRLDNREVKEGRLTVIRVEDGDGGERIWYEAEPFAPDFPLRKMLPPGRYRVEAHAKGYQSARIDGQEVSMARPNLVRIKLEPATRKGIRFPNRAADLTEEHLRISHDGRTAALADVELPVNTTVKLIVEAEGYLSTELEVNVPEGNGPFDVLERLELERRRAPDRWVSVRVTPASAAATISMDGRPLSQSDFRTSLGSHVFAAQAPGYRESRQEVLVDPSDMPLTVALSLSRPTRRLRIETGPGVSVRLRPHGQAELPRPLSSGEEIELDVGLRLVARAERDGMPVPPERDLTIEAGPEDVPQSLAIATGEAPTLQLARLPFPLRRQSGGSMRLGIDKNTYEQILDRKLPAGWRAGQGGPLLSLVAGPSSLEQSTLGYPLLQGGELYQRQDIQEWEARVHGAFRVLANRRTFQKRFAKPEPKTRIGLFYIAEVPVPWSHWVEVMDESDLPAAARRDLRRFLREHGDEPAGGIRFTRWDEFCRRLTEHYRAAGQIGLDWSFSPPTAAEFESVMKGGITPQATNGVEAWLQVEQNLEVLSGRRAAPSVWEPDLIPNAAGVRLGLASTWTTDAPLNASGRRKVVGPSPRSRPNTPKLLKWKPNWPSPREFHLPDARHFLLHDVEGEGFWPWRSDDAPVDLPSAPEVGLYVVLRPTVELHAQATSPR